MEVFGYELLFRGDGINLSEESGASQATNQIIVDTILEHGLQQVVGSHLAFINFSTRNILDKVPLLLPKDRVVIEVLENIKVDQAIVEAVRELASEGYCIALDDFVFSDQWRPLVQLADIIKIDVRSADRQKIRRMINQLKAFDVKLLAEKVETQDEYQQLRSLGCHYFQGYFFSKPNIVPGKRVEISQHSAAQILAAINKPDVDIEELAETISRDVGLSYKLLRYINSAYFALRHEVESIQEAIVYLGQKQIRMWATILTLSSFSNKPNELLTVSLTRAKMCERLASRAGENSENFFLVGVISNLDSLLDIPMKDILESLPLAEDVRNAVLQQEGIKGQALRCAVSYEQWNVADIQFRNLGAGEIRDAFLESVDWADGVNRYLT
jgi:EAL and modified HD-GYP domain-containing signal transduction protein